MADYYDYAGSQGEHGGSFFGLLLFLAFPGLPAIFLIALVYAAIFVYLPIKLLLILAWMLGVFALGSLAFLLTRWAKVGSVFNLMLAAILVGLVALYSKWAIFFYLELMREGMAFSDIREMVGLLPNPMIFVDVLRESAAAQSGAGASGAEGAFFYWVLLSIWIIEGLSLVFGPAIVAYSYINEEFGDSIGEGIYEGGKAYLQKPNRW